MEQLKRRPKTVWLALAAVVVIGVVVYGFVWSQSSTKGTITTKFTSDQNTQPYKTLEGKSFSVEYSSRYAVQTIQPKDSRDLEIYNLIGDATYDKRLAVTVAKLPSGKLADDGSYNLRHVRSDVYEERARSLGDGSTTSLFVKKEGGEQVIFIARDGRLATIAFSTSPTDKDLPIEVDKIFESFSWK